VWLLSVKLEDPDRLAVRKKNFGGGRLDTASIQQRLQMLTGKSNTSERGFTLLRAEKAEKYRFRDSESLVSGVRPGSVERSVEVSRRKVFISGPGLSLKA